MSRGCDYSVALELLRKRVFAVPPRMPRPSHFNYEIYEMKSFDFDTDELREVQTV